MRVARTVAIIRDAGLALPVTEEQASTLASIDTAVLPDFSCVLLEYSERHQQPLNDHLIKRAIRLMKDPLSSKTSSQRPGVPVNLERDAENG